MANVLHRTTLDYLKSVSTGRYDPAEWIINPDLSQVAGAPKRHWKIQGDTVALAPRAERDAADLVILPAVKDAIMVRIDEHVASKIAEGFEWPVASGKMFSLSLQAQLKWMGLFATTLLPPGLDKMVYPLTVPTIDDLDSYDVVSAAEVSDMYSHITATVAAHLGGSMKAKAQVNAAATIAEAEAARDAYLVT